jgi:hypothetical protein
MLPLGLKRSKVDGRMACRAGQDVGDGKACAKTSQRQPFLFSFRGHRELDFDYSILKIGPGFCQPLPAQPCRVMIDI